MKQLRSCAKLAMLSSGSDMTFRKLITLKIKALYFSKRLKAIIQPHGATVQKTQFLSSHAVVTLITVCVLFTIHALFLIIFRFVLFCSYMTDFLRNDKTLKVCMTLGVCLHEHVTVARSKLKGNGNIVHY
jgi:hypothetical protein